MKYTIGEFASILGVTVDTLRLYEKYGIIKPMKNSENNYRYFDDLDARNLLMSRWYRSVQISLQDTAILTKDASTDTILDKMNETQLHLQEEIKKSQRLLGKLEKINKEIRNIETRLNRCETKQLSGIYRMKQTDRNDLIKDDGVRDMSNAWMDLLPYTFFSFQMDFEELMNAKKQINYNWGMAIFENEIDNTNMLPVDRKEWIEYIPPRTYLSTVILLEEEEYITRNALCYILDYIRDNHYAVVGDIIGKLLINEKINGNNSYYVEVNIPI